MALPAPWNDSRSVHVLTRGNVDGIVSSALMLSARVYPDARVTYVPSATGAIETLRKDIGAREFVLVDIGLTPKLIKTLNQKAKSPQLVTLLDHHQQSAMHVHELAPPIDAVIDDSAGSAAGVVRDYFGLDTRPFDRLVAIADLVEYGRSPCLTRAWEEYGEDRIEHEAHHLDFAWRLQIDDDRFRVNTARRLATGLWPSEIPEVRRRYLTMVNEQRWARARERVMNHVRVRNGVALLDFGKRKPSLLGFGSRALTSVATDIGCTLAVLVNRRGNLASLSLRATGPNRINLGLFVERFTRVHGLVGGGHPTSAGAKIHVKHLPTLLSQLYAAS